MYVPRWSDSYNSRGQETFNVICVDVVYEAMRVAYLSLSEVWVGRAMTDINILCIIAAAWG